MTSELSLHTLGQEEVQEEASDKAKGGQGG